MIYYIQPLTIIGSLKKDYGIESVFQKNKHKKRREFRRNLPDTRVSMDNNESSSINDLLFHYFREFEM